MYSKRQLLQSMFLNAGVSTFVAFCAADHSCQAQGSKFISRLAEAQQWLRNRIQSVTGRRRSLLPHPIPLWLPKASRLSVDSVTSK